MIKTILLTGTGGFVGRNLGEHLKGRYTLLCPRSFELDLTDPDAVEAYFKNNKIDFVIHCGTTGGARGIEDPESCETDNLSMVVNLINSKYKDTKMILFGSGAAYDKSRDLKKVKESEIGKIIPKDLYGVSKMKIAKLAESRDDMLCLNIFACYGRYEKESRFPTFAVMQNLKKEPIIINKNVVFDYLYIKDLCRIVEQFISKFPKNRVINVTPNESISLFEIAQMVNKISGYKSEILFKEEGLNFEYTGDNTRLLSEIPDFAFTSYENGLCELYSFCKKLLNVD